MSDSSAIGSASSSSSAPQSHGSLPSPPASWVTTVIGGIVSLSVTVPLGRELPALILAEKWTPAMIVMGCMAWAVSPASALPLLERALNRLLPGVPK